MFERTNFRAFPKRADGLGLMGAWGKKRFAAKCIFRENGELCVLGEKRKVRNIILCKLLLIQAIHNFALTNYLSKLCCCCSPAVESTSSAA